MDVVKLVGLYLSREQYKDECIVCLLLLRGYAKKVENS
jgi:hypothetical protein